MQKLILPQIIAAAMVIANKLLHPGRIEGEPIPRYRAKKDKRPNDWYFRSDKSNLIWTEGKEVAS